MPAATITARSRAILLPGPAFTIFLLANPRKKARSLGPKATAGSLAASSNASAEAFAPASWCTASRRRAAAQAFSLATPSFKPNSSFLPRLLDFVYSPWLTANLTLDRYPESHGGEPSWDTVFLDSPTLGYVDAMHQSLRTHVDRTVWTFY